MSLSECLAGFTQLFRLWYIREHTARRLILSELCFKCKTHTNEFKRIGEEDGRQNRWLAQKCGKHGTGEESAGD